MCKSTNKFSNFFVNFIHFFKHYKKPLKTAKTHFSNSILIPIWFLFYLFADWLPNWRRQPPIKLKYSKPTSTNTWKTFWADSKICNSSPVNRWTVMVWLPFANTVTSMVCQRQCFHFSNTVLKRRNSKPIKNNRHSQPKQTHQQQQEQKEKQTTAKQHANNIRIISYSNKRYKEKQKKTTHKKIHCLFFIIFKKSIGLINSIYFILKHSHFASAVYFFRFKEMFLFVFGFPFIILI